MIQSLIIFSELFLNHKNIFHSQIYNMQSIDDAYIDLSIANVEQSNVTKRTLSSFYQTSSQVLIPDTTNYKLSIIRFVLNTQSIPIYIPQQQVLKQQL